MKNLFLTLRFIGFVFFLLITTNLTAQDHSNLEKEIFKQINKYRTKIGQAKFTYNPSLVISCRNHSKSMGVNSKLEHVKNFGEVGANAEIIQLNYTDGRSLVEVSTDVLEIFLDSPPHKKIIEDGYKQISIGVYVSEDEDLWVTIRLIY
ncbi:MAG: hypothetical protein FJZ67_07620 [Bacteroidetes bacterium]|nr:hypothetical protein [Bacteroidota bacterium]